MGKQYVVLALKGICFKWTEVKISEWAGVRNVLNGLNLVNLDRMWAKWLSLAVFLSCFFPPLSQLLLPARPVGRSALWEQLRLWVSCLLHPSKREPRFAVAPLCAYSQTTLSVNSADSFLGWMPCSVSMSLSRSLSTPQPLPGGLHMHESWEESKLRLHQLWQLRLGLPGSLPTHDTGLLGEPLHAGKADVSTTSACFTM